MNTVNTGIYVVRATRVQYPTSTGVNVVLLELELCQVNLSELTVCPVLL
jgi:hypothetical protein